MGIVGVSRHNVKKAVHQVKKVIEEVEEVEEEFEGIIPKITKKAKKYRKK